MGTVYEGFDPVIERPVAIKTILAEYLANVESTSAVARFKLEAQAGGRLQHPAIVGVYESVSYTHLDVYKRKVYALLRTKQSKQYPCHIFLSH